MSTRNGRDPGFTARAVGLIKTIHDASSTLMSMRHPNGMPALQFVSGDELAPLDILRDVVEALDKWETTRERQGRYSQQQKLLKQAEVLKQQADELMKRANQLNGS
jgi:hypothetical protein